MTDFTLRPDERVAFALRSLYAASGYSRFQMGKFEEYELYLRNKDFLAGERMISFTDGDGQLLALKPDVTISIIKSTQEGDKGARKVYYQENVYRSAGQDARFREIMQMGLECIGPLSDWEIFEVIELALCSLAAIGEPYTLSLSHMGLVAGLLQQAGLLPEDYNAALLALRQKNAAAMRELGSARNLCEEGLRLLALLVEAYGPFGAVLDRLEPCCLLPAARAAMHELRVLERLLLSTGETVQLDLSVVNDLGYYNGIVFQGFVRGLPAHILSGGRYDKLVAKMGKSQGAIGFALSLSELSRLPGPTKAYDVDALLLYDETTKLEELNARAKELRAQGKQVLVGSEIPARIRSRVLFDLREKREG